MSTSYPKLCRQMLLLGALGIGALSVSALSVSAAEATTATMADATAARDCAPAAAEAYADFDFLAPRAAAGLGAPEPVLAIEFFRQNVFPDADHLLARLANRFNVITRESTLRAALPFVVGDRIADEQLEEAERVLRDKEFLYDARVLVRARCASGVVVAVIVRDVWTLTPSVGFGRAGGDNQTQVGITESNLFGLGKAASLSFRSDRDRSGATISYADPNILGSRWVAALTASDNDDGEIYAARLERPFYALDATWAAGLSGSSTVLDQDLEYLSERLYEVAADQQAGEFYLGRSRGRVGPWVDRFSMGVGYRDERFDFPLDFPGEQRIERRFVFPFVRWERIEDRFVTGVNLDRVERTEDLQLGLRANARLGWSSDTFGGQGGDVLLYDAGLSKRWFLGDEQLLGVVASLSGRYALDTSEGTEDLVASTALDYLWRHDSHFSFYARLGVTVTRDLDPESQLTLGGDTDLRGYPSRYQPGDRRYLATLEERYYSDWFPFGLFRVGLAAFVDVGRAWFEDAPPAWVPMGEGEHFGTLVNVGFGLRLESVRTRRDRVLHIDFAHPLVDGPGADSLQVTLSAKRSL